MKVNIDAETKDHIGILMKGNRIQELIKCGMLYGELNPIKHTIYDMLTIDLKNIAFQIVSVDTEQQSMEIEFIKPLGDILEKYIREQPESVRFVPRLIRNDANVYMVSMITIDAYVK